LKRLALLRVSTLPFETLSPLRAAEAAERAFEIVALERSLADESRQLADGLHAAAGERAPDADPESARARLLDTEWRVDGASDRAGWRLTGPALAGGGGSTASGRSCVTSVIRQRSTSATERL